MDEYIIWNMVIKKPVVVATIEDYIDVNFKDRCKSFRDIGLKDTNGKSIYADCSIFEVLANHKSSGIRLSVGYFSFNKQYLRYEIIFIDGYMKGKTEFYHLFMSDFKIIDTIQENKLGLIKA